MFSGSFGAKVKHFWLKIDLKCFHFSRLNMDARGDCPNIWEALAPHRAVICLVENNKEGNIAFFLIVLHCIAPCCTVLSRTTKGRLVSLNWNVRYPHRSHSNRSTSLLCFFKLVTNENGLSVNPLYVQFGGFAKRYAKKTMLLLRKLVEMDIF